MSQYLNKLVEDRQSAYHAAKAKMDEAAAESRDLSAEEREFVDRTFAELDEKRALIDTLIAAEKREAEIAESMRGLENVARPVESRQAAPSSDADILREIISGERRGYTFGVETRDVLTSSSNAPVPTTFSAQVLDQARMVGPMIDPSVVSFINTSGGEPFTLPSLATWSTAAIKGEGEAIAESDPGFGTTTLNAYKASLLIQVSPEMVADSNVNITTFLSEQAGNAFGTGINAWLTTGTGTVQPTGVVTSAAAGVTGGTATATRGTGYFTADDVIDLVYSLDGGARTLPGFAVMGSGSAIAALRKLKTANGDYVFVPTLAPGTPDTILGSYRLIENPAMAAPGSGAVSLVAGDLKSYFVRSAGGLQVSQSADYAFANDLITLKFIWRVDGALPQTSHIKKFTGGTA